jgi:hypothetical protein
MMSDRDKKKLSVSEATDQSLAVAERDLEIQRKQELRAIERENMLERGQMINEKTVLDNYANRQDNEERSRFHKAAQQMDQTAADIAPVPADPQPKSEAAAAVPGAKEDGDKKSVKPTKERLRYGKEMGQEKAKFTKEKDLFEKAQREQADSKGIRRGTSPAASEAMLHASAEDEKRILDQQRDAIRKDFESGVEKLYVEAVDLFKKRIYEDARQDFLQVDDMIQGYKKTGYYLEQIEKMSKVGVKPALVVTPLPSAAPIIPQSENVSPSKDNGRAKAVSQALDSFNAASRP